MVRESIATATTVDAAIELACEELGISSTECAPEILQLPKKGLFGKIKQMAKVKVTVETLDSSDTSPLEQKKESAPFKETKSAPIGNLTPSKENKAPIEIKEEKEAFVSLEEIAPKVEIARVYLNDILQNMGMTDIQIDFSITENKTVKVALAGSDIGAIIGKRGETLDALQYLLSLVANRSDAGEYVRFTINAGNYREKREETLKSLAHRMAGKALKTGRPCALEPMNPYERRIIHAVITDIEGVYSKSSGEEPNRKVVIKPSFKQGYHGKDDGRYNRKPRENFTPRSTEEKKPSVETVPEKKSEPKQPVETKTDDVKLYSKIEL